MMRISNQWIINSFNRAINKNMEGLSKAQIQISSGKQIQTPSENPVNNALSMQYKTAVTENDQYVKNISRTTEWLDNTDSALSQTETILQRARELAVQGANDTLVQTDRDAIATEIDQLLQQMISIGNTDVAGEYIFSGAEVKNKPFNASTGQNPFTMLDMVTYSDGTTRKDLNASNILDVSYAGNDKKISTEIEKGSIMDKNITGSSVFYRGEPITPQPSFSSRTSPITDMLQLSALNSGKGVQPGSIVITDNNGVDTWIDLKNATRIEDVMYSINATNSFKASIEEVSSDTAVTLGIAQNVANSGKMTGQPLVYLNNPSTDFDPTVAKMSDLGVSPGFLSINTRDGKNRRLTVQSTDTLQTVINNLNALDSGRAVKAEFDPFMNRLMLSDVTGGIGEFSIESKKTELKIQDIAAHTAGDLGLATTDTLSDGALNDTILSTYAINSQATPLSALNGDANLVNQFAGYMSLVQDVVSNNSMVSPTHAEIASGSTTLASLNSGSGLQGGGIMVTGRDGVVSYVNLSSAATIDDIATAINTQTAGRQTANWDNAAKNFQILDNTVGTSHFTVTSAMGPEGVSLASLNGGMGIEKGYIKITSGDGNPAHQTIVDLRSALTVNDVINAINTQAPHVLASFDSLSKRLKITDLQPGAHATEFRVEEVNDKLNNQFSGFMNVFQNVGAGNTITSPAHPEVASSADLLGSMNGGLGLDGGSITITGRDGITSTINLSGAATINDVVNAINLQTGGNQIASWDNVAKTFQIVDNTFGAGSFQISPATLASNLRIREASNVAKPLGILKSNPGGTAVFGDSLPGATAATLLSTLVPKPDTGFITIRGSDGKAAEIDLTRATTIQDVINQINVGGRFKASWDTANLRLVVEDTSNGPGSFGMTIEEKTNTARDLGFINGTTLYRSDLNNSRPLDTIVGEPLSIQSLPTLSGSIDLNPAVNGATELSSLNSNRPFGRGINLGKIRIVDRAYRPDLPGHDAVIDLRGAKTMQDVLNRINDPANGIYVEARINQNQNGIELVDQNHGAAGHLAVYEIDSTTAADLGFLQGKNSSVSGDHLIGGDLDPALTNATTVSSLRVNEGGVPLGKVLVQSGEYTGEIDLTGCKTIGDMLQRFSATDTRFNLSAWIDPDGRRINLTNTKGQPFIKVRDEGEDPTASSLGLGGSRSIFETLQDLRDNLMRNEPKAISEQSIKLIDEDLERVLNRHAEVGVKTNRAQFAKEKQVNFTLNISKMLDVVENVDMTEAVTRMTNLQTAFQAALQVGSRVLQTTLLDFLK